jgi:hypothetical protein
MSASNIKRKLGTYISQHLGISSLESALEIFEDNVAYIRSHKSVPVVRA